ncbi:MAG: bifunctional tRNA (5-methylaminomethyl-2-thiouridine)(34)-methyltransferase MnmD/FAD-dependent [Pseudomonadota bacterium]|jgi:tRNA 5-methylaminomethyl-2-thiouridine biosynthesis bifunctional protein
MTGRSSLSISPARILWGDDGVARSADFDDVYASTEGAWQQAQHVFLSGNGLPQRWRQAHHFTILETGFGLGTNFLATWAAWREDPDRCRQLTFISIEKHPPLLQDLQRAHQAAPYPGLAQALMSQWPLPTPNFHVLDFEEGHVRLILALGDVRQQLSQIVAPVDAFFLDGFAPAKNPQMWDAHLLRNLQRLARAGATVATWSAARQVRDALRSGGFQVANAPGFGRKKDMTVAHFEPTFAPKRPAGRQALRLRWPDGTLPNKRALIIGGGLAGAHAAHALTHTGWQCTVADAHPEPAGGASGNPAGIFHPTFHVVDTPHARLLRAASFFARHAYQQWQADVASLRDAGRCEGVFRAMPPDDALALQFAAVAEGLARPMTREQALSALGLHVGFDGHWLAHGGWMDPGALTRHLLKTPGIEWKGNVEVGSLTRKDLMWEARSPSGGHLGQYPLVVMASGHRLPPLLQASDLPAWPLQTVRGQVTWWKGDPAHPLPTQPLAGLGYAVTLGEGQVLCGATAHPDDADPQIRAQDHAFNVDRFKRLSGYSGQVDETLLSGRVSWRLNARDRLPMVGALPVSELPQGARLDQARLIPRLPGLYVMGALGSRGLTWAPLLAQVLVSWVEGTAFPIESDLLDAIDPARWQVRQFRSERQ